MMTHLKCLDADNYAESYMGVAASCPRGFTSAKLVSLNLTSSHKLCDIYFASLVIQAND